MRVRGTPASAADLQQISDYLASHHPEYRQSTMRTLYNAISSLKRMPNRGRRGREEDTRELFVTALPYVAVYRIREQSIEILRIYHAAQDRH